MTARQQRRVKRQSTKKNKKANLANQNVKNELQRIHHILKQILVRKVYNG